jgi:hypothetical protein
LRAAIGTSRHLAGDDDVRLISHAANANPLRRMARNVEDVRPALARFHSHVLQFMHGGEALPHRLRARSAGKADDRSVRTGADAPHVEVEDAGVAGALDLIADFLFQMRI